MCRLILWALLLVGSCSAQICGNVIGVADWSAGTNGNAPTVTDLAGSTFGVAGSWVVQSPTNLTYSTAALAPWATSISCPGVYTGTGSASAVGLSFATQSTLAAGMKYVLSTPLANLSAGILFRSTIPAITTPSANEDIFSIFGTTPVEDYVNIQFINDNTNAGPYSLIECYSGNYLQSAKFYTTTGDYYWLFLSAAAGGTHYIKYYDCGPSLPCSINIDNPTAVQSCTAVSGATGYNEIFINDGKNSAGPTGYTDWYGALKIGNGNILLPSLAPTASLSGLSWAYSGSSATLATTCTNATSATMSGTNCPSCTPSLTTGTCPASGTPGTTASCTLTCNNGMGNTATASVNVRTDQAVQGVGW